MPKNVRRFVWLWLLSSLVDAASAPFSTDRELLKSGFSWIWQIEFSLVADAIIIGIQLPFFWLAVSRRKNWARWVIFIVFVLLTAGGLFDLFAFSRIFSEDRIMDVMESVSWLLDAASFYFLFTGDARPWFARKRQLDADVFL